MKERRLFLCVPMILLIVACAAPGDATRGDTASRPHDVPDLEAVLPGNVGGRELARWSARGQSLLAFLTDQDVAAIGHALAPKGLTIDDFVLAAAGRMNVASDPPHIVVAYRAGTIPAVELPRRLGIDHPEAGAWTDRTIGGKLVHVGTDRMLVQDEHQRGVPYVYNAGPVRVVVVTDDEAWAADALRRLQDSPEQVVAFERMGDIVGADGAPMVLVPAGEFLMGSASSDAAAEADERPQHRLVLNAFHVDKYEVTNGQYRQFLSTVREGGHSSCDPGEPNGKDHTPDASSWNWGTLSGVEQPVVNVDWYDAAAYCARAGKRLPTEAAWEKAARGTDGRIYPWGGSWDASRANSSVARLRSTVDVGSYPDGASPYGAEDVAGNVWEWVRDWYGERSYDETVAQDPAGPSSGTYRIIRGGSAINEPDGLRSAVRNPGVPLGRIGTVGVRCAQDLN